MHSRSNRLSRTAQLLAAGLVFAGAALHAARAADNPSDRAAARAQHRQEWVHARLERSANRLEITASQQGAWQEYANARMALAGSQGPKPRGDLDAATLVKLRADRAAEGARKLAVLADATAKLQAVLSPAQRQTLVQMTQREHRHHFSHGGQRGWQDGSHGHGGEDRGEGHRHASDNGQGPEQPAA